jgi:CubicO group peptidase (beta-lactamase class C family)
MRLVDKGALSLDDHVGAYARPPALTKSPSRLADPAFRIADINSLPDYNGSQHLNPSDFSRKDYEAPAH